MIRRTITVLLLVILYTGVCFANGQEETPAVSIPKDGKIITLNVGTTNKIDNIYHFALGGIWPSIFTHESMFWPDSSGGFTPVLAESWEVSDDMKTWTFHIVKDALWHDGVPLTAKDIEFTMNYYKEHSKYKSSYRHLVSIEAVDDYTLVTVIDEGDYSWLGNIGKKKILPEHIWKDINEPYKYDDVEKIAIGSGPYVFNGYNKSAGMGTWTTFKDYRKGIPNVETVKVHEFGNEDTMIMSLDKHQIDVVYNYAGGISYFNVPKLLRNENITVETIPSNGITNNLWFNTKRTPFNDSRFRSAISYAVDYEELKKLFTAGYGDRIFRGWIPSEGFQFYQETEELLRDLDRANAVFQELGYIDSNNDGFREFPDGSELAPVLTVRSDKMENIRVAECLVKYFNEVGLNLQIKLIDRSVFFDIVEDTEEFDMVLARTTFSGMTAYGGYGSGYVDDRDFGWATYENKEFQDIVDTLHTTIDEDERTKVVHNLMDHYAENVPVFTLYNMGLLQPSNTKYKGYTVIPVVGIMSPDTWYNLAPADK